MKRFPAALVRCTSMLTLVAALPLACRSVHEPGTRDTSRHSEIRLLAPIPDTLYQRIASIQLATMSSLPSVDFDPGTVIAQEVVPSAGTGTFYSPDLQPIESSGVIIGYRVEPLKPLENGRHRVVIHESADDSLALSFVVQVRDVPFAVEALDVPGVDSVWTAKMARDGAIAGTMFAGGRRFAVVWRQSSATVLASPSASTGETAAAVNVRGDVVGSAWVNGCPRAALWRAGGAAVVLDTASTCTRTGAVDVNDGGDVLVAVAVNPSGGAYIRAADGGRIALPMDAPTAMNELRQVVGSATTYAGQSQQVYGLTYPGGNGCAPGWGWGPHSFGAFVAISDSGAIAGYVEQYWTETCSAAPGSTLIDLGPFLGPRNAAAMPIAIRDDGTVLGFDRTLGIALLVANARTQRVSLPDGWRLVTVSDMNGIGQIAGTAIPPGSTSPVAVRPTPMP